MDRTLCGIEATRFAGVDLDAYLYWLERHGIHVRPSVLGNCTILPLTGDAVDHLLHKDVMPIVWIGLPEWLQPFIRWIWIGFRKLVMWMLALTLPDDIKNGYQAKALLWGK